MVTDQQVRLLMWLIEKGMSLVCAAVLIALLSLLSITPGPQVRSEATTAHIESGKKETSKFNGLESPFPCFARSTQCN